MITIRHAEQRGKANFGWLDSRHTFSFGHYYDPGHMGFSALRVINDDKVKPRAGFDTHGHQDMEIISLVLDGTIVHRDSEGNRRKLPAGEYQLMSAGRGISHSEYNGSKIKPLHFLQIWIEPSRRGGQPGYQQKRFPQRQGLVTIASPDGADDSLQIKQDATLQQLLLEPGSHQALTIDAGRKIYIHQINGQLEVNDKVLAPGDGAKICRESRLLLQNRGEEPVKALIFDLPPQ